MYALGRNLQYYDAACRPRDRARRGANNYTLASLVMGVVKSVPFQMRDSAAMQQRP